MPQDKKRDLEGAWHVVHVAEPRPLVQVLVIGSVLAVAAVDERRYQAEEAPADRVWRSREAQAFFSLGDRPKRRGDRRQERQEPLAVDNG